MAQPFSGKLLCAIRLYRRQPEHDVKSSTTIKVIAMQILAFVMKSV